MDGQRGPVGGSTSPSVLGDTVLAVRGEVRFVQRTLANHADPLVRRTDRLEAMAAVLAMIATVAMGVLGLVLALASSAAQTSVADAQRAAAVEVSATTTGDATDAAPEPNVAFVPQTAPAQWRSSGRIHEGTITVPDGTAVGTDVPIWVDRETGDPTSAPVSTAAVHTGAVAIGVFTFVAGTGLVAGGYAAARYGLDRARDRAWTRDLERNLPELS